MMWIRILLGAWKEWIKLSDDNSGLIKPENEDKVGKAMLKYSILALFVYAPIVLFFVPEKWSTSETFLGCLITSPIVLSIMAVMLGIHLLFSSKYPHQQNVISDV